MELETFELDGKKYVLFDEIFDGENTYLYFKNETIPVLIRKVDPNNEDLAIPLDNTEEALYALNLLNKEL